MNGSLQLGNRAREKPRRVYGARYCPVCPTRLSRYNDGDACYLHSPKKYPRARGRREPR